MKFLSFWLGNHLELHLSSSHKVLTKYGVSHLVKRKGHVLQTTEMRIKNDEQEVWLDTVFVIIIML